MDAQGINCEAAAGRTPGPWKASGGAGVSACMVSTTLKSGRRVRFRVAVCRDGDIETVSANARLIAAAPDLLEAVQELLATHPAAYRKPHMIDNRTDNAVRIARAAIAKATGARS